MRLLWTILAAVLIGSFAALLYYGREVYQMAPPVPERIVIVDADRSLLFSGDDIRAGQDVWRSIGGHDLGSIWATAPIPHRTGLRTGCTGRRSGCWTTGPTGKAPPTTAPSAPNVRPRCGFGSRRNSVRTPMTRPPKH